MCLTRLWREGCRNAVESGHDQLFTRSGMRKELSAPSSNREKGPISGNRSFEIGSPSPELPTGTDKWGPTGAHSEFWRRPKGHSQPATLYKTNWQTRSHRTKENFGTPFDGPVILFGAGFFFESNICERQQVVSINLVQRFLHEDSWGKR